MTQGWFDDERCGSRYKPSQLLALPIILPDPKSWKTQELAENLVMQFNPLVSSLTDSNYIQDLAQIKLGEEQGQVTI